MNHAITTRTQYVSLDTAAERLGCSTVTIRRMISRGKLTGYKLGTRAIRVDEAELDRLLRPIPSARG